MTKKTASKKKVVAPQKTEAHSKPSFFTKNRPYLFLGVSLVALGSLGVYVKHRFSIPSEEHVNEKVETLEGNIQQLNQRISHLKSQINDLERHEGIDVPEQEQAHPDLEDLPQSDLERRFFELQKTIKIYEASAKRSYQAWEKLRALKTAIKQGKPFQSELNALFTLSKKAPFLASLLESLKPYAKEGVETYPQLVEDFDELTLAVARAKPSKSPTLKDQVKAQINTLFTVRSKKNGSKDLLDKRLKEVRTHLLQQDVSGALEILSGLQNFAQEILGDWRKKIETYANIQDTLQNAEKDIFKHITK